jgi:hypothetical protein
MAVFEARRAIGQLVRTFGDGVNPPGLEASDVDPVELVELPHGVGQELVLMGVADVDSGT